MNCDYWPEPIAIITAQPDSPESFITIEAVGLDTRTHYTTTLPQSVWEGLEINEAVYTFDGASQPFRLALEAERLRLAYTADPLLAANNALVDLLPHQMEAVYGVMLPQPRIRHLMAHDAGAGKTIMGGLLYKELAGRQPDLRTLIVAPAALTRQWQRELQQKFLVEFEIVDRSSLQKDIRYWTTANRFITSTPFARQPYVQATLANVPWDLVLVDEAHHMAGYADRETLAYDLGRILSRNARHLVLATATPHKGDRHNFLKLLRLLDGDIYDPAIVNRRAEGQRGNPVMLRRLKEEMVDFNGNPLFKPRVVETKLHTISGNPPEMELYRELTKYIDKTYRAAERIGGTTRVNTEFAMVILQRRMASSFAALEQSLLNRKNSLLLQTTRESTEAALDWAELEEEVEANRWQKEQQAELATPARTQVERDKEVAELEELLALLDAVRQTGRETKVEKLQEIMAKIGLTPDNQEKLLVFTEARDTLVFLRRLFEGWGYTVTQIDGGMPQEARLRAEADFQGGCQIMVATEAAGEGINLQFCAFMINYDLPWVPTRLEQRMGRIHRYGQTRVAHIYNLTAADTREGEVLLGLLERLEEMRTHLGDQVYDVVSTLVSDAGLEKLMTQVAVSSPNDDSHERALRQLREWMAQGAQHQQAWRDHPFAISNEAFQAMKEASRQSRLTPEYAQHFFVDALNELNESPAALPEADLELGYAREPGDATVLSLTVRRNSVAADLGLPAQRSRLFTFHRELSGKGPAAPDYLALGAPLFDRLLALARRRWGKALTQGARFIDLSLSPGDAYLLWFLTAQVRDGLDEPIEEKLLAVRQWAGDIQTVSAAALNDLVPTDEAFLIPDWMREQAANLQVVIDWSLERQQLPFLDEVRRRREWVSTLRREPALADARAAESAAQSRYDDVAFYGEADEQTTAEQQRERARQRVLDLTRQFDHEAACSLGPTAALGVAAVFALAGAPEAELIDERPGIAAAAVAHVVAYEGHHGRQTTDVSGEHSQFPYDLYSAGPGGPRCIEVKGTTTGRILLSETELRAAQRLRHNYYLYVVGDPLGDRPALTIVRDPWSKMAHDDILYSGARYVYNAATWRAAADEETSL
jgi:SNF2 family DNA or RNA helicase